MESEATAGEGGSGFRCWAVIRGLELGVVSELAGMLVWVSICVVVVDEKVRVGRTKAG